LTVVHLLPRSSAVRAAAFVALAPIVVLLAMSGLYLFWP